MKIRKMKKSKGFTLIELLLVVSIILILMGFLMPKFSSYESKVKSTKAINTAKQLQTAAVASYGDNNGKFLKDDVQNYVEDLTSANNPIVSEPDLNNQSISINYKSDDKDYEVLIDASQNDYTVKDKDGAQIYPK